MKQQKLSAIIPKSTKDVEPTSLGGLTKRQLIAFITAGTVGFLVYLFSLRVLKTPFSLSLLLTVIVSGVIFFIFFYKRNGLPTEKLLYYIYLNQFKYPKIRPYDLRPLDKRNKENIEKTKSPVKKSKKTKEKKPHD